MVTKKKPRELEVPGIRRDDCIKKTLTFLCYFQAIGIRTLILKCNIKNAAAIEIRVVHIVILQKTCRNSMERESFSLNVDSEISLPCGKRCFMAKICGDFVSLSKSYYINFQKAPFLSGKVRGKSVRCS